MGYEQPSFRAERGARTPSPRSFPRLPDARPLSDVFFLPLLAFFLLTQPVCWQGTTKLTLSAPAGAIADAVDAAYDSLRGDGIKKVPPITTLEIPELQQRTFPGITPCPLPRHSSPELPYRYPKPRNYRRTPEPRHRGRQRNGVPLSTLPMLRRQGEDDALKVGLLADHQFAALEDSVRDGDRKLPSSKKRRWQLSGRLSGVVPEHVSSSFTSLGCCSS